MKFSTRKTTVLALPLLAASLLAVPSSSWAGDRQLWLRLVNMTPDAASSETSKKCVQTLRDQAAQDHLELKPMTETPLRKLIGAQGDTASFFTWNVEKTRPATKDVDSLLLVDCRPEERSFDAVLFNKTGARVQFRLRGETIDRARAMWLMDEVLRHGWAGFEL
ncbi:MAG TPA: hypothetical protein VLC09_17545 [Polyangiaceae bacterium]|nr:hypothetical protein [Polyangiaceae bacterium]